MKSIVWGKKHEYDEKEISIAYPHRYVEAESVLEWVHGMHGPEHCDDIVYISCGAVALEIEPETARLLVQTLQEALSTKRNESNNYSANIMPKPEKEIQRKPIASWTNGLPDRRNFDSDEEFERMTGRKSSTTTSSSDRLIRRRGKD